jgi:hypothetical protein
VDGRAGSEPVRLERHRRDRAGDRAHPARHGCHLPDDPDPPGDHRPGGGDLRVDDGGPVLPWPRHRREPERARRRGGLAGAGRAPRDARGGNRGHSAPLAGRIPDSPGGFFDVEQARLYTLPAELPAIAVAAAKPLSADLAGRAADAFVNTAPDPEPIEAFESAGGQGKPKYGQITGCWAESAEEGARIACEVWPNAALSGDLGYELPLPLHYEQATADVTAEDLAESIPCGPDPDRWLEDIRKYEQTGYTHIYFHQIGRDQEGFLRFWAEELAPKL